MIVRIVRMTFRPEEVPAFLEVFERSKEAIRHFDGCLHLELLQQVDQPNVMTTYSHWTGPEALERYRHSELFKATWAQTKIRFADKPVAISFERLHHVDPSS